MGNKHVFSIYHLTSTPDALAKALEERDFKEIPTSGDSSRLFVITRPPKVPNALRCLGALASDPAWAPPEEVLVHAIALFHTAPYWYVVGSGPISSLLQDYASPTLGLDLICRLTSQGGIAESASSIFTGPVTHETRTYRGRMSPAWDFENVSRLFRRLVARLPTKEVKSDLGLPSLKGKQLRVSGGTAVKVHHLTSLDELRAIISRLDEILSRPAKFSPLMGASPVASKTVRRELHLALLARISQWMMDADAGILVPDDLPVLSHEDPRFSLADNYELSAGVANETYEDIDFAQVVNFMNRHKQGSVEQIFKNLRVACAFDGETIVSRLHKCLQAEVYHQKEWYFLLHGDWYKLSSEFGTSINKYVERFLIPDPLSTPHSPGDREDDYLNEAAKVTGNTLFHRKPIVDGLELCDLLQHPGVAEPCLVFAKRGTGQAVRALVAQATESATRLYHDPGFLSLALAKVRASSPEAESSLADRRFSVHLLVLSDRHHGEGGPFLEDLSNVARLNLALGIQSLVGLGVRSVRVSIIV